MPGLESVTANETRSPVGIGLEIPTVTKEVTNTRVSDHGVIRPSLSRMKARKVSIVGNHEIPVSRMKALSGIGKLSISPPYSLSSPKIREAVTAVAFSS
jgi:hypothetical protein